MANKGRALSENELQLSSGGKVVLDVKKASSDKDKDTVVGAHLYGDGMGEDQGYFTKEEIDNGSLERVAKALGTSLDVADNISKSSLSDALLAKSKK